MYEKADQSPPDALQRATEDNDAKEAARRHQEELLDEAVEESFPASDPVSVSIVPPS